jgi:ABC-type lipoprotein release transport system permease subunit
MIFSLAWRNIWRNKARGLVIMTSISLGLFAGIAVLALYEGMLKGRIRTLIDEETGHIQIHHSRFADENESKFSIPDREEILRRISGIPEVSEINQRSLAQGMLSTSTGTAGVQVIGIDTLTEFRFSSLKQKIREGTGFKAGKSYQAIIGMKLARKMKLQKGSKMVLMFNDTGNNLVSSAYRISAIYQSTNAPLDERLIYTDRAELSELIGMPGQIHEIALKVDEDGNVEKVCSKLKALLPGLKVEGWKEISPETDFLVQTVDTYSAILIVIIMISLAFGILNTMLMAIMERSREIGMIAALGMSRMRIFSLVLLETIFLSLAGVPLGLFCGWATAFYFNRNGLDLSGMGEDLMSSFGFKTVIYPEFPADKLISVLSIVLVTTLLSSLIPAFKAINMKPVENLKV